MALSLDFNFFALLLGTDEYFVTTGTPEMTSVLRSNILKKRQTSNQNKNNKKIKKGKENVETEEDLLNNANGLYFSKCS